MGNVVNDLVNSWIFVAVDKNSSDVACLPPAQRQCTLAESQACEESADANDEEQHAMHAAGHIAFTNRRRRALEKEHQDVKRELQVNAQADQG